MEPLGGRISGRRLAILLGEWRQRGSRQGASDLAAAVELHVLDGQLPIGTRLPAERELADALGVSRTLIGAALDRLRADGLVASRRGAGSWVAGVGNRDEAEAVRDDLLDLARAAPPAVPGLMAAFDTARRDLIEYVSGNGYLTGGLPRLRERIAERYTARGLPTSPDQVLVTSGAYSAFVLCLRMLSGPGDRVLLEQPTYPNAIDAVRATHALPVPVALDPVHGWDLPGIEAALRQAAPRFGYLVVDFQNPTGLRLDAAGRERLGGLLARSRTPVVVDESLVELDYEGDPVAGPPPLAAFGGDLVLSVGSAAKSQWGGLRLGWIRASTDLLDRLQSSRFAVDLGAPVFDQLVLAALLEPEGYDVLARRRAEFREQRDITIAALRKYCPEWTFQVPSGGLSLWCRLPEPMSTRLAVSAANHGVQIAPGSRFGVHGGLERWLRLPFGLPREQLPEAVRRVSAAAASVRGCADVPAERISVT
ncbi:PLP-dependent aminotransferase family protein [Amycolatopsis rubida]|uniref:PLP-dependent aminotransferase family protein n=1 Tax=Amycolatopsis rubida TaxID=112413 RepID=A0ABX0BT25_9PSEU|nr:MULTISPECIES: PLP-dependent aminotransferase family protein [Amycolatopsis]MYW92560.1 aminotransferase class I/II-fold pyridoxal phosphate-dependent enzyme [Amycolatopsis rubida]NEC57545.1 PLP-dependent aminotransferase family protein [Amycolatopsis rubida]OAP20058.1 putative HTH-type transcriptional regulator YdcR [Amycolatopsis sp. M39]